MTFILYVLAWLLSLVLGVSLVIYPWWYMALVAVGVERWQPWDWLLVPLLLAGGFACLWLFTRLHEEGP